MDPLCSELHCTANASLQGSLEALQSNFLLCPQLVSFVKSSLFRLSESWTDNGHMNMSELQEDIFFQWICVIIPVSYTYVQDCNCRIVYLIKSICIRMAMMRMFTKICSVFCFSSHYNCYGSVQYLYVQYSNRSIN